MCINIVPIIWRVLTIVMDPLHHTSLENLNLNGAQVCEFFLQPQKNNNVQIFNVMFSRDERGFSYLDDKALHAVIKILWFHM